MRASRRGDRPVRHLEWRVRMFGTGAVLALAGMVLRWDWLVNVAIVVLLLGFLLRFVPERSEGTDDGSASAGDGAGEEPHAG